MGRFVLGAALLSVLSYAGYRFVYRPVHALLLYNQGYKLLEGGSFRPPTAPSSGPAGSTP